jgi:photosystem II stability/assembly factor-like uncharacterized protein
MKPSVVVRLVIVAALALACAVGSSALPPAGADALPHAAAAPLMTGTGQPLGPAPVAVDPATAANDIAAPVTITGSGFAADSETGDPPAVTLGDSVLTDVTLVDASTLTATVPWGMDPGLYALTITGAAGSGTLPAAFTVTSGIGRWNTGDLFGGEVRQLLMKPGDPDTLYASSYNITGLFRSDDAGEHWSHIGVQIMVGNGRFAVDPAHPGRLYTYSWDGLCRSADDGDTWTRLTTNPWPGKPELQFPQVFVSPYESLPAHPQALFVGSYESYGVPDSTGELGLVRSTDGGATWAVVPALDGVPVQDLAFDPSDHAHVVAATSDGQIWQSSDWGGTWTQTATDLPFTSLGATGSIAFNPYRQGEAWISSKAARVDGGGIYKSTVASLTTWQDVSVPGASGYTVSFAGPDSVYCWGHHSTDGGLTWPAYGPNETWYGDSGVTFQPPDPGHPADPLVAYIGDDSVGIRKTTDGGHAWAVKVHGLTGLRCDSLSVSQADPLRVYGAFAGPLGIYRSDDGTGHWTFLPIDGAQNVRQVMEDPADPQYVYVGADSGFYASEDQGETWMGDGWKPSLSTPPGLFVTMAADPFDSGHLLASFGGGAYGVGEGYLYGSDDRGASWDAITVREGATPTWIHSIVFDPDHQGAVYLTADGVYRSTDGGATWDQVEPPQHGKSFSMLALGTHPRHVVIAETQDSDIYRSWDQGETWELANDVGQRVGGGAGYLFAGGDSTRLYAASYGGLNFSSNAGATWAAAAGAFGRLQILAIAAGKTAEGRVVLYTATSGSEETGGAATGPAIRTPARGATRAARGATAVLDAGVYRYVVVAPKAKLGLSGLRAGVLRLRSRVTVKGTITPAALAGDKATMQVQRHKGRHWVKAATSTRTIASGGRTTWKYRPVVRGAYRVRLTMAKTATHAAMQTRWRSFRVR